MDALTGYTTDVTDLVSHGVPTVSIAQLQDSEEYFILDVRGADEYDAGHIPGAHRLASSRLVWNTDELPKDQAIVVYCASGRRAAIGASAIRRLGFDVLELDGNFGTWAATDGNVPAVTTV